MKSPGVYQKHLFGIKLDNTHFDKATSGQLKERVDLD